MDGFGRRVSQPVAEPESAGEAAAGRPAETIWFATAGDMASLRYLREQGRIDVAVVDSEQRTALHLAVDRGCSEAAALLLEAGSNPDAQDSMKQTPLHIAAMVGWPEIVSMLVAHGADKSIEDESGMTALQWATEEKRQECVSALSS